MKSRKITQLHNCLRGVYIFTAAALLMAGLTGCAEETDTVAEAASIVAEYDAAGKGTRDNTPQIMTPAADGSVSDGTLLGIGGDLSDSSEPSLGADPAAQEAGNSSASSSNAGSTSSEDQVRIDTSHMEDGYLAASYKGPSQKVKLQITPPNDVTYTYNLTTDGEWGYFPLSCGDGEYDVGVYTNIQDTMYATAYATTIDVKLTDEFGAFLYPNQYVWFTPDTRAILQAQDLAESCDSDLDVITIVYNWTVANIAYDQEEAETVESGYIPDVDEVMDTGKGICFDYASLMAAMLRSQGIPTRMEIGYAGTAYHAWISTYIEDRGWVNGIIQFDGVDWSLMDPTLASSKTMDNFEDFIGDGSNYRTIYNY